MRSSSEQSPIELSLHNIAAELKNLDAEARFIFNAGYRRAVLNRLSSMAADLKGIGDVWAADTAEKRMSGKS